MRDQLSSSQIQQILKKEGCRVDITLLKVLLRDLGFKWNGAACNLTQFFVALRNYLHGQHGAGCGIEITADLSEFSEMPDMVGLSASKGQKRRDGTYAGESPTAGAGKVIQLLQDVFYATRRNLYELYRVGTKGNTLDFDGYKAIIADCSRCYVTASDVELTYRHLCGQLSHTMTFE
jgi:hypothetical protein